MSQTTLLQDMSATFDGVMDSEKQINTDKFCLAVRSLVQMLEQFGFAFNFVAKDMSGNCSKVETFRTSKPDESTSTLQRLVSTELSQKRATTTQGLVWLTRGLRFLILALTRFVNDPTLELAPAFTETYQTTLRIHHGFAARTVVNAAFSVVQTRAKFIETIAKGSAALQPKVPAQMAEWLVPLEAVTRELTKFLYTLKGDPVFKKQETLREEDIDLPVVTLPVLPADPPSTR